MIAVEPPAAATRAVERGRGFVLEHHLAASVEEVWATLVDGASYPAWNPFVMGVEGRVAAGARLSLRVRLYGRVVTTPHVVTAWSPGRGFGWRQTVPPVWLLHGERRHLLAPHPDGGTHYRDVFWLAGPLGGVAASRILEPVRAGMASAALGLARHLSDPSRAG